MKNYEKYKSELKKFGYVETENISDFWFANKDNIWRKIFFNNGEIDVFGLHIRWEAEIGKKCREEIINYINNKQKESILRINEEYKKGIFNFHLAIIDFSDFKFQFENKTYNLISFAQLFPTSQSFGSANLRGINLDNIKLDSCKFINCFFADASFKNSSFQQIFLENTNFTSANFENSRFVGVMFDKNSTLNGANFKNAFVNAIDLNDNNLSDRPLTIRKVRYITLLWWSLLNLFRPIRDSKRNAQTTFLANQTKGLTRPELVEFKKYVNWFQHVYKKVYRLERTSFISRITLFFEVLMTKYWTSFMALAVSSFFINLFFVFILFLLQENFSFEKDASTIDCFYYSISLFTTFGYSDITPVTSIGQFIVIIEGLTGYIILGLFIFLVSKRIDSRY